MKQVAKRVAGFLAVLVAISANSTVNAGEEVGQWYLVPAIPFIDDDKDRGADDQIAGFQLALGRAISEHFNLEVQIFNNDLDGFVSQDLSGVSFDFLRVLDRDSTINVYLLGGVGFMSTSVKGGADSSDMLGSLGLGANFNFKDSPVAMRAEARLRSAMGDPTLNDMVYSLGVKIPFGEGKKAPLDSDGDGVADANDRCPGTPAGTSVDEFGCERDDDGDGVANSMDRCPNTPAGARVDSRGCEIDTDGDGVPDQRDACPNTPRGAKVDARGCELDDDKDGVPNSRDRCPNSASGVRVDIYGCEIKERISLPGVEFDLNKATLRSVSFPVLDDAAATLRKHPDLIVEVAGHTDSSGDAGYNQGLSERRAKSVRQYLIDKGVKADMLQAKGYGESKPVGDNSTKAGRATNRRVDLEILNQD